MEAVASYSTMEAAEKDDTLPPPPAKKSKTGNAEPNKLRLVSGTDASVTEITHAAAAGSSMLAAAMMGDDGGELTVPANAATLAFAVEWMSHESAVTDPAWVAKVTALPTNDINLLCSTIRLADYLGVDALQEALAQSLADACCTLDGVASVLGEQGAENEELVDRIKKLVGGEVREVRRAFVLAAQVGPAACLTEDLMAVVAARIPELSSFVLSGAGGYARDANGAYAVIPGETSEDKPVFRQIENPDWWMLCTEPGEHCGSF